MNAFALSVYQAWAWNIDRFQDDRGFFEVLFSTSNGPPFTFDCKQVNCSKSKKNVLRGIHIAPFAKLVHCVKGKIFDVVLDTRPESPTYLKWSGVELNEENRTSILIPTNCGHGFLALEDSVIVYAQDGLYNPKVEQTIRFDDPIAAVRWPGSTDEFILSEKDRNAEYLST
jgi:dTDP-4-dehydrorhamnose 3,5-epimerase